MAPRGRADVNWAASWENLFMPYVNNKGTDQPAHLHSLTSTFVVCCLDSTIPLVSISKISSFYLASVAVQADWALPGWKPWRQVFSWCSILTTWTHTMAWHCNNGLLKSQGKQLASKNQTCPYTPEKLDRPLKGLECKKKKENTFQQT